jgi:nucleotide-binding universal stress UspA family protein
VLKRILVAVDGSPLGAAALELGLDWALRFGADLMGVGILDEPSITGPEPVPLGATAYKHERDEARLADAHRQILHVLARLAARCRAAGIRCAVIEDVGTPHEQIVLEAEACDLVMLGRQTYFHFETQDRPDATLSHVLRHSPRPVVVVPPEPAAGAGTLVAYNGSRAVARALQTFTLLGLDAGQPVHLLAAHGEIEAAERTLQRPAEYLAAHGVRASLEPLATDAPVAETIEDAVRRHRPRLLVVGAPAHHPVRDLFFASVTRAVLRDASIPVFVGA